MVTQAATLSLPTMPAKPPSRDHISYSSLSLYAACPLRWYFKYVAGLPEETVSASLVFGSGLHRALQLHFQELLAGNAPPSLDALLSAFWDEWRSHDHQDIVLGKGDDTKTLASLAERMLRVFLVSDLASPAGTIIGVEEEFRGRIVPGLPDLLARVDLLVDDGDSLVLTDFKSARTQWSESQVSASAEQLLLYHELVAPLAQGRPVRLTFAVLSKTKLPELVLHPVPIDAARTARAKLVAERIWQAIQAKHFYPSPSPIQCPTCPYRDPCQKWGG
jgi:CRISPR/Cas system-associated exonuclease Cas4 (RecB family)